jgi:hypothetical protein
MKKLNLHEIFEFGRVLNPLSKIEGNSKISDQLMEVISARLALNAMMRPDSPLLETARRAVQKLIDAISRIVPADISEAFKIGKDEEFSFHAHWIKEALRQLESVLGNDMPGIAAYHVSKKGIFNTEDLITQAEYYLTEDIRRELPVQACTDLREAGKCLAYELPTACVFHLWRAVEAVMAEYHDRLTGTKLPEKKRNWSAYIQKLNEANADEKITAFLNHIREHYRNPQTHPEINVELSEAQQLFGAAMSSINQILLAIKQLKTQPNGSESLHSPLPKTVLSALFPNENESAV